MTDATDTAAAATSRDPGVGLRAVAALRRLADQLEALQVGNARAAGWSWEDIGIALGVSKQAVHKKYGRVKHVVTQFPDAARSGGAQPDPKISAKEL